MNTIKRFRRSRPDAIKGLKLHNRRVKLATYEKSTDVVVTFEKLLTDDKKAVGVETTPLRLRKETALALMSLLMDNYQEESEGLLFIRFKQQMEKLWFV